MVASTRDRDRRAPATLAAAEDDSDDEERQQDRGDRQLDDTEQPAGLRPIVTLVAVRRRANFANSAVGEDDRQDPGLYREQRYSAEHQRGHSTVHDIRRPVI